ncbi:MAG: hypothetical protein WA625_00885 [Pseudolabrys sp.]
MAIAIFNVADSTIGCKNGAAGLLGIAGQPVVNGAGSDHGQIYAFRHQAVQRHRDRDRDRVGVDKTRGVKQIGNTNLVRREDQPLW